MDPDEFKYRLHHPLRSKQFESPVPIKPQRFLAMCHWSFGCKAGGALGHPWAKVELQLCNFQFLLSSFVSNMETYIPCGLPPHVRWSWISIDVGCLGWWRWCSGGDDTYDKRIMIDDNGARCWFCRICMDLSVRKLVEASKLVGTQSPT